MSRGIRSCCRSSASSCSARSPAIAVYLPELFPTHVRSTAVGFCTGSARVVTSFGPLVAGLMVSTNDVLICLAWSAGLLFAFAAVSARTYARLGR